MHTNVAIKANFTSFIHKNVESKANFTSSYISMWQLKLTLPAHSLECGIKAHLA